METLLKRFERPVPRYTSYPTAPHFSEAIGPVDYARWLKDIPEDQPLSLYAHVPYCDTLCWFCGCHTKITAKYEPIASYLEVLLKEVDLAVAALGQTRPVAHIHWGGGSPTILTPSDIERLAGKFTDNFDLTADAEFALEIDPRGVSEDLVAAIARAGFNRASLGIQDVNEKVQKAINRVQPMEENRALVEHLHKHGITRINLDLMYGLPFQTDDHIRRTVEEALTLEPSRIALFGYAHVPWMKSHMKMIKDETLPGPVARLRQSLIAAEELEKAGFVRIGLDHFARSDDPLAIAATNHTLSRNFQGYTTDRAEALIGFGASAIGSLPQGYIQNAAPIHDYRTAIEAGEFAIVKGIALDNDDRTRRAIISDLMCHMEVDLAAHATDPARALDQFASEWVALEEFERGGLLTREGTVLRLSETGRVFMRPIAAVFDVYLSTGKGRHSIAV
ncbi:MAG: oxygen-independent coproporphyrinogen III oxidase [Alphaproteobacteria bacterium]|nr:MAG: oxygen-independent coproporphyrinogen III oxidase [Alphaproteobacteria bacterium]